MSPALTSTALYCSENVVYLFGGKDDKGQATNKVFKLDKANPTTMETNMMMRVARSGALAFNLRTNIVVMGGSDKPMMEVFDVMMNPVKDLDTKSQSLFYQLACYTGDSKLENSSVG